MRRMLIALVFTVAASCGASENQRQYTAGFDVTWEAAMQTLAAQHFSVKSADRTSGTIWLEESKSFGGIGSASSTVNRYTTQKASGFSNWRELRRLAAADGELVEAAVHALGFFGAGRSEAERFYLLREAGAQVVLFRLDLLQAAGGLVELLCAHGFHVSESISRSYGGRYMHSHRLCLCRCRVTAG
jgi:hypothetical protein